MKIYLKRQGDHLIPCTQNDADELGRIKDGDIIYVDYKKPRNPHFHNKFMSMVRTVFDNQEQEPSIESMLAKIKVELGYYDSIFYGKIEVRIPKSISFSAMDELKFDHFYNRAVAVCLHRWLPETTPAELEEYVSQIAGYSS